MGERIIVPDDGRMNFKTISEFKWCINDGGEVEVVWNNKTYGITRDEKGVIGIYEAYKPETEKLCKDVDEVLEYIIDGMRLRNIVTKVKVVMRTI